MGQDLDGDQGLTSAPAPAPAVPTVHGRRRTLSAFFARKRRTRLALLLLPPGAWLIVAYLGSIAVLLLSAFWTTDSFTNHIIHTYDISNLKSVYTEHLYRTVALRSLGVALLVTIIDALIAVPMAMFMSLIARPWLCRALVIAVLTPLWASYLVKAYAWRVFLQPHGPLSYVTGGHTPGYGLTATVITLAYLWLPYMIIPVYAGFERLPRSLFEASADLGAGAARTLRSVVLPMVFPAIAAGSIFTFSLTLGDYIAVGIVGGKTQLLANVISSEVTYNQPLAAAVATMPLLAIVLYLLAMRRTGALENV